MTVFSPNNDLVDVEIHDYQSNLVYQRVYDNQFFTSGVPIAYNFNWVPPSIGSYTVQVGVFTSGWETLYNWNNSTAVINAGGTPTISIWWPTNGSTVSGTQPFKALLNGMPLNNYSMFWQVDGGQLNSMYQSGTGGDHMEAMVNLSSWTWNGTGPYNVNFVAKDSNGEILTQSAVNIKVVQ